MRRLVCASLLLIAFLAVPSVELHAQKDKKKMDAPDKTPVDSAKLSGEFIGKLKNTPGTDRIFVITSETKKLVPTGKGGARIGGNYGGANRIITLQNNIANDQ